MAESLATYLASIRSAIQSVGADVGELRKRFGRGPTAQRPTAAAVGDGALWFDTTSGALMAVVNGAWVACGTPVPAPAATAGYTRLAFFDEFDSLSSIDFSGSGGSAVKWRPRNPWEGNSTTVTTGTASVSASVLSFRQVVNNYNIGLYAVGPATGFKHGYFEARIRWDTSSATSQPAVGWPSFWSMAHGNVSGRLWEGEKWAELDFLELWHPENGAYQGSASMMVHQWEYPSGGSKFERGNYANSRTSLDPNVWHTYGCLWRPGSIVWYVDGNQVVQQSYSANGLPVPGDPGTEDSLTDQVAGCYSCLDSDPEGVDVFLGTGTVDVMQVDWVRVWQAA